MSSLFSALRLVPNTVSASSTMTVGGSSSGIERTSAAGLTLTEMSGAWQVPSTMSSSLLLPHRFSGDDREPRRVVERGLSVSGCDPGDDRVMGIVRGEDHEAT